jgi:hypothetical protein
MAYCHALLQFSGHGQQELTFYLPLTALERERNGIAADYVLHMLCTILPDT